MLPKKSSMAHNNEDNFHCHGSMTNEVPHTKPRNSYKWVTARLDVFWISFAIEFSICAKIKIKIDLLCGRIT